jgi:hypothetical protein
MLHVQPPYRTGQFICSKTGQLYLLTTVWRIASSKIYFKVICFLMKEFIRNNFILSLRGMIMGGSEGVNGKRAAFSNEGNRSEISEGYEKAEEDHS